MNKLTSFFYDAFAYLVIALFGAMCITVPAAITVWAIRWILIMFGMMG